MLWLHHVKSNNFFRREKKLKVQYIKTLINRKNRCVINKYSLIYDWRKTTNWFEIVLENVEWLFFFLKKRRRKIKFVCNFWNNQFRIACNSFLKSSKKFWSKRKLTKLSINMTIKYLNAFNSKNNFFFKNAMIVSIIKWIVVRHFSMFIMIVVWFICVQSLFIVIIEWRTMSLLTIQINKRQKFNSIIELKHVLIK